MNPWPLLLLSSLFALATGAEVVTATREDRQVIFRSGSHEILRYQAEPGELPRPEIAAKYRRGGYIQSIHSPSGRHITEDFPADHPHHHPVWSPWTKTEFEGRQPDFWNMGSETGTVEFVKLGPLWQKDGKAGLTAHHQFIDLSAKPAKVVLLETWELTVAAADGVFQIDFTSSQRCASASPLKLPKHHYGGFGFRGHAAWNGPTHGRFLGSSGQTDRVKLNTSREKWLWIGGPVDKETCGVMLLCHPKNFRFPQPVRVNPDHPFVCYAPQQLGEMTITPDEEYVARYRMIVADGEPDAAKAEQWWQTYAAP
jgi:hypothetical protein